MKKIIFLIPIIIILSCMSKQDKIKKRWTPDKFFEGKDLKMGEAIYDNNLKEIEFLLKQQNYNANGRGSKKGYTYLGYSVLIGNVKITEELIKLGADIDLVSRLGSGSSFNSNINIACDNKNKAMIYLLLKYKVNLNPSLSESPIIGVLMGNMGKEIVELLINHGADINYQAYIGGDTPIVTALQIRNFEMVDYFLDKGTDPLLMDYVGNTFAYLIQKRIEEGIGNEFVRKEYLRIRGRLEKEFHVQYPLKNDLKKGMELAIQRYENLSKSDKELLGDSERVRIRKYRDSISKGVSMTGKPFESYK